VPAQELPLEATAPGKVVLFGEHAVVYGYPGITASIGFNLRARITRDPDGPRFLAPRSRQVFEADESGIDLRLFGQAVDRALAMYNLQQAPIAIEIESELVPGMGLGSSAACSTALCLALRKYAGMDNERRYSPTLFAEVQQLESIFHGNPSGMDAATVLSGGVLWFRGGTPREILPIRLPHRLAGLICIVEPGARTIELVSHVRHSRELAPRRVDGLLEQIGSVTTEAGSALGAGDVEHAGALMLRNHELLAELGVSTPGLDRAVELLSGLAGVHGAKLTGAGGGGAVIALVEADQRPALHELLAQRFALVVPFDLGGER
jgi:mevalonate kinase